MQKILQRLTIQEVSERVKISKPTLRFWEKELEGVLVPLRTEGGQRRYTSEHLFIIEEIKRLRLMGLRLADIKKRFANPDNNETDKLNSQVIDLLADQITRNVRSTIYSFFEEEKLDH
jgi:DNA-binding transcriptional MerR regulator